MTPTLSIRELNRRDEKILQNLLLYSYFKHRHLDWFTPAELLGRQPYLALFEGSKIIAALACPPDSPQAAWIRLFAVSSKHSLQESWNRLWTSALASLKKNQNIKTVAIVDMQKKVFSGKLRGLLKANGFSQTHRIAILSWTSQTAKTPNVQSKILVRDMQTVDIPSVQKIDQAAFPPLWHNSALALERACQAAAIATVAVQNGQIIGFQISTGDTSGGHLARLAISPNCQNQGAGTALLHDLLKKFEAHGCVHVTVNTQIQNAPSLKLYKKFGFYQEHRTYPVYQIEL